MLQYFPNITGSLQVTGSVSVSGSITATGGIIVSGSIASASYSSNSELLDNLDSTAFVFTSSFNTYSSSMSTRTTTLENASASLNTASGSFSGRVTTIESKYATTGSNIFTGAQTVCANITSTGTIIAQTLNVQQVTSSVVYSSGSNVFGCSLSNTQQFTGSVTITGSLGVSGNTCVGGTITGTTIYGSTLVCSAMICSPQSAFTYTGTTGNAVRINGDNLTTGTALSIVANNGSPSHTGNVVEICNAFNAGAAAKLLCLYQGDDGDGIYVNMARGGVGLTIDGVGSGYSAIFNNGNVGIGCTAPSQKLDIGSGHIKLSDGYGLFYGTQTQVYASEASKYVRFDIAGTSGVMFLTGSGNVGIGTTTPGNKLSVSDSTSNYISVDRTSNNYRLLLGAETFQTAIYSRDAVTPATGVDLRFVVGTTEAMRISGSNANVGIGTSSPSGVLHVEQTTTTGLGLRVQRNLAAASTDNAVAYITNNNASDDQPTLKIEQVGSGDILQLIPNSGCTGVYANRYGRVGIGTNSPTGLLDVYGASTTNTSYFRTNGAANRAIVAAYNNENTALIDMRVYGSTYSENLFGQALAGTVLLVGQPSSTNPMLIGNANNGALIFGTNNTERMRITSAGYVTKPYQVAFKARNSGNITVNADAKITLDTTDFNVGSGYSTSTGIFTAPVAGKYLFNFASTAIANGLYQYNAVYLIVNGAATGVRFRGPGCIPTNSWFGIAGSIILDLSASGTVQINGYTEASSMTLHINETNWTGYLLG